MSNGARCHRSGRTRSALTIPSTPCTRPPGICATAAAAPKPASPTLYSSKTTPAASSASSSPSPTPTTTPTPTPSRSLPARPAPLPSTESWRRFGVDCRTAVARDTPCIWGCEASGVGFDCYGLVQAAIAPRDCICLAPPNPNTKPAPDYRRAHRYSQGTGCSSPAAPTEVTHIGLVISPGGWSAPPTPAPMCASSLLARGGRCLGRRCTVGFTRPAA